MFILLKGRPYAAVASALLGVVLAWSILCMIEPASATKMPMAPGDLDPTFANGGKATTAFEVPTTSEGYAIALQPDGKVITVGKDYGIYSTDFALTRHNSDGSLDTSFGGTGKVLTNLRGNDDEAFAVALQGDGKIVVAGYARSSCCTGYEDFALVRYNSDGSLDTTFGTGGIVTTEIGGAGDILYSVTLQTDGKIVAAGTADDRFALARYNPNGSLDASFGVGGIVNTYFPPETSIAYAVALQSDGKIVAAGRVYGNSTTDFALARYNSNGTLDTSFDTDGRVTTDFLGSFDTAYALAVQGDGKIVATGYAASSSGDADFGLARYNADGSLDNTFDVDGKVTTDFSGNSQEIARSLALQADGKLIAAGITSNSSWEDFALARYNLDGSLDTSFDTDGKVTTDFGPSSSDNARGIVVQPNGVIVTGGYVSNPNSNPRNSFALVRYLSNGSLDTSFGSGGKQITALTISDARAYSNLVQPDGKIVVAGAASRNFALARYNTNGTLDSSFGAGGTITTTVGESGSEALAVALQTDGKVVAAGYGFTNQQYDVALARYNTDGSLDSSFGASGVVTTNWGFSDAVYALGIQPDGKIVAAGTNGYSSGSDFALARYNPNGSLDTSFGNNGIVITDLNYSAQARGLAIQPDGKILAVGKGTAYASVDQKFALARYNPNGSLDTSFGSGGTLLTDFSSQYSEAYDVKLRPNGKIVVVGQTGGDISDFALAQYNPDGSLDTSFSTDGKVVTDFDNYYDLASALILQDDGKVVAAGLFPFKLARYNIDGSLDTSFGIGGKAVTDLSGAEDLALQMDGKLVASGFQDNSTSLLFASARYIGGSGPPGPTATSTSTVTPPPNTATFMPTNTGTVVSTNTPIATTPINTHTSVVTNTVTSTSTSTPIVTATACSLEFDDVAPGSTFYEFVRCLACRGIISGYSDGTFRPNNLVTRGQLAKIVSNAAGFAENPDPQIFEDVASANTFYQWINRLTRRGYMSGYICGAPGEPCVNGGRPYFRPGANATRGQTSKIVSNAAQYTEEPTEQTFEDVTPTHTFYKEIQRLASRNIMGGYPCGGVGEPCLSNKPYFRPNNDVTRGQSAKIVANTFYPNCQTP